MTSDENSRSQSKSFIVFGAALAVAVIGFLDFITVWDVSFFALYALPIFVVAWTSPKSVAIGFTVFCAGVAWAVNVPAAPSISIHSWRSLNRLVAFSFVATAGAALRMQKEHYRSRLEALERTRELEQEIIRVSEREQRRIGQDLHDSVCQNLAAIDCATGLLKTKLETRAPAEANTAEEIQDLLRKTLLETRSLARGIFPVQVEKEGLAVAIEEMVATANRLQPVPVSVETQGEIAIKNPEIAMHLYRIAQEALSNALRHAGARAITISLRQDARRITLAIKDDGSGSPAAHPQGMGLRTIGYRAQLLGAELVIDGNPATGTLVQCTAPLPNHDRQS